MRCTDFLHHYSALRDRTADPDLLLSLEVHLAECATCARYHEAVHRGVGVLRDVDGIEPSPGFGRRLRGRLAAASPSSVEPSPAGVAAALMFAAALTLGAYEIASRERAAIPVPTVAVAQHRESEPPATMPYAARRIPPASDFTLSAFRRPRQHAPMVVVDASSVPLGTWASLPR